MESFVNGIKSLLGSEKAIASGVLAIAATVFVILDKMSVDQWIDYTQIVLGIYVAGKTTQGAVNAITSRKSDTPVVPPANGGGE